MTYPNPPIDNIDSYKILTSEYLYDDKHVQIKTHRKNRINKKWRKKYGFKVVHVPSQKVVINERNKTMFMHPEILEEMKLAYGVKDDFQSQDT